MGSDESGSWSKTAIVGVAVPLAAAVIGALALLRSQSHEDPRAHVLPRILPKVTVDWSHPNWSFEVLNTGGVDLENVELTVSLMLYDFEAHRYSQTYAIRNTEQIPKIPRSQSGAVELPVTFMTTFLATIMFGARAESSDADGGVNRTIRYDGQELPCDCVIVVLMRVNVHRSSDYKMFRYGYSAYVSKDRRRIVTLRDAVTYDRRGRRKYVSERDRELFEALPGFIAKTPELRSSTYGIGGDEEGEDAPREER